MAQAPLLEQCFHCSICLDVFKVPVTIPCGHSYCMGCLKDYWDQQQGQEACSCPQCRHSFSPRPTLGKNTVLADMLEKLSKVRLSDGPSAPLGPPEDGGFHHATFDVSAVVPERNDGERLLRDTQRQLHQRIQERETELVGLKHAVKSFTRATKAAVKDMNKIFSELMEFVELRRAEMKELIRAQEKAEVSRVEGQLQRLEQEITELKKRDSMLERLSHNQDYAQLSRICQSYCGPTRPGGANIVTVNTHLSFGAVRKAISDLKERLEDLYRGEFPTVTREVKNVSVLQVAPPSPVKEDHGSHATVPSERDELLQFFCPLSLDPFTVHRELCLSERNRAVSRRGEAQPYPDHPDRFDTWGQALCREVLQGRVYWEAEWEGMQVELGLTYESIARKGSSNDCGLGRNSISWSLRCSPSSYEFNHDNQITQVVVPSSALSRRIGVFVNQGMGLLCFYSITPNRVTLLHRVQTSFTQPLYPAVWLGSNSSITLSFL